MVSEQAELENVSEKLCDDDVAGVRQETALNGKPAAADGGRHAVKKKGDFSADEESLIICRMKVISLVVAGLPSFLNHSCP